jgi:fatty-acyl-CoA synthase
VSGNSIDHVVAFFACAKSGVAFVPCRGGSLRANSPSADRSPALVLVEDEYEGLAADALRRSPSGARWHRLGTTGVEAAVPARLGPAVPLRGVRDDDRFSSSTPPAAKPRPRASC